jgi:hypothetical protein
VRPRLAADQPLHPSIDENGAVLAVNTTVVAVVAPAGRRLLPPLAAGGPANVRILPIDPDAPTLDRATMAYEQAQRTSAGYLVHDADPLAWVASSWAGRFEGSGVAGDLEVAVTETLARWRARSLDLPDYYLLTDPEGLAATLRHWYLGVLGSAAPVRVVTVPPSLSLIDRLPGLRTGPWWPSLDRVLAGIDQVIPDQMAPLAPAAEQPGLVVAGGPPGSRTERSARLP